MVSFEACVVDWPISDEQGREGTKRSTHTLPKIAALCLIIFAIRFKCQPANMRRTDWCRGYRFVLSNEKRVISACVVIYGLFGYEYVLGRETAVSWRWRWPNVQIPLHCVIPLKDCHPAHYRRSLDKKYCFNMENNWERASALSCYYFLLCACVVVWVNVVEGEC